MKVMKTSVKKRLLKRIQYLEGQRDALIGKRARIGQADYVRGYAEAYAEQQQKDQETAHEYF